EVRVRDRPGEIGQQARPVAARGLDHRGGLRGVVVQHHRRRDGEGGGAAKVRGAAGLADSRRAPGGALPGGGGAPQRLGRGGAERLAGDVLHVEDVQRLAAAGGEDPGADHVGAGRGDGGGEIGEQPRPVGGGHHHLGGVAGGDDPPFGGGASGLVGAFG